MVGIVGGVGKAGEGRSDFLFCAFVVCLGGIFSGRWMLLRGLCFALRGGGSGLFQDAAGVDEHILKRKLNESLGMVIRRERKRAPYDVLIFSFVKVVNRSFRSGSSQKSPHLRKKTGCGEPSERDLRTYLRHD